MKNISKILTSAVFALFFLACGNSTEENDANSDTTEIITESENTVIDQNDLEFIKFEDYTEIKSKDALIAKFGKENLKDDINYYAEGTVEMQVTILTNPENQDIITYVWDENFKTNSVEASYFIYDDEYNVTGTQKIETNKGLFLGMSLSELRDWNGADFKFSGFGWDYGGSIFADQESKIGKSNITLYLQSTSDQTPSFALGDVELNADNPRLKEAKVIVSSFDLYLE